MHTDIRNALDDNATAAALARTLIDGYLSPSLGAISKSEMDNLVFRCLVEAGAVKTDKGIYDIARRLSITPAKAKSLLFQWQLRQADDDAALRRRVYECLLDARFSTSGKLLTFGIESPLLREKLRAMFIEMRLFPDGSFSDEIVKIPIDQFVEFLDHTLDDARKTELVRALCPGDTQHLTFKGVFRSALQHWAGKVLGRAGDQVVEEGLGKVNGLMRGALQGDLKDVEPISDETSDGVDANNNSEE